MKCYVDKGATLNLTCGVVAASPMASAVWSGRGTITFKVPHCLKTLIEIILSKEHKNTFIVLNTYRDLQTLTGITCWLKGTWTRYEIKNFSFIFCE